MKVNLRITPIQKLDAVSFDALLTQQDPFNHPECKFDLQAVRLITPAGLVQLAAACHALKRGGRKPIIAVQNDSVRNYLVRSGFVSTLEQIAQFMPPYRRIATYQYEYYRGSSPMLIEVTKIEAESALPTILDKIVWVLRHRMRYHKYDAFDIATAVSEIAQNTFDHNYQTCGFIAMQVYGEKPDRFVEIGVADYGGGLTETLKRNPKNPSIRSDLQAIYLATQLGISEHDDPTRGTGLHHLLDIAFRHEGSVQIRSGAGAMRFRMDKRQGWGFNVPPMPGVHVTLTLQSKTKPAS